MSLMSLKGANEFDMYMMTWRGRQSSQPCDIFQVERDSEIYAEFRVAL